MNYYESDRNHIFDKITSIKETIFNRLLPVYNDIEEEAKKIEEEKLKELATSFNTNNMDSGDAYQINRVGYLLLIKTSTLDNM